MVALLSTGEPLLMFLGFLVALIAFVTMFAVIAAYLPELYEPRVRCTGAAVGYNLGGVLGGALTPIVATALAERAGRVPWGVGAYLKGSHCSAWDASRCCRRPGRCPASPPYLPRSDLRRWSGSRATATAARQSIRTVVGNSPRTAPDGGRSYVRRGQASMLSFGAPSLSSAPPRPPPASWRRSGW